MKEEAFLSKEDEKVVIKFLYEIGMYIIIDKNHDRLNELNNALEKLEPIEKEIIKRKYLSREAEYTTHQQVQNGLFLFANPYIKYRSRAFVKLATELGIGSMQSGA